MSVAKVEIILAYRHLHKHLLRAVQYSQPARTIARDRIRAAFRQSSAQDFHATNIARTIEFLDGAAKARGLEHKVVKNLIHVWWGQRRVAAVAGRQARNDEMLMRKAAYEDFERTIEALNASMGLCIR